ncbi:MAG: Uma2 family endonuclease [Thiotrichales bacterium]
MALPAVKHFSVTDYLAWENEQPTKNEYLNGEVFAMVGATRRHNEIALNVATALKIHLDGARCRPYISDMKLHVRAANAFFYPDVMVTCEESDHKADLYLESPALIVEVLSDSTQGYDRGAKFAAYRTLDSLKEYVLIDPEHRRTEIFRRNEEGLWVLYEFVGDKPVTIASVALTIAPEQSFNNVD